MLLIASHLTEILIIMTNGAVSVVTYMIVPEEKHPHLVRRTRHHIGRLARAIRPGRSASIGRHRYVRN